MTKNLSSLSSGIINPNMNNTITLLSPDIMNINSSSSINASLNHDN